MAIFVVEWECQIHSAKDVIEACKQAAVDISSGEALCFTVTDEKGKKYSVDLNEEDGSEVYEIED